MKNDKRGISGVVTAVLLILLVIAAIGILWVVVQNFVQEGTTGVKGTTECTSTDLSITNISNVAVTVKRDTGNAPIAEIRIIVDGTESQTAGFGAGLGIAETATETGLTINSNVDVEVAAVVTTDDGEDVRCGASASAQGP